MRFDFMKPRDKKISVRMTDSEYSKLEAIAKAKNVNVNEAAWTLLRAVLEEYKEEVSEK
jgi:hypothetical protein